MISGARTRSGYRYILMAFVGFSAILVLLLLFYSMSTAQITVQIQKRPTIISKEFEISPIANAENEDQSAGSIFEEEVTDSVNTVPSSEQKKSDFILGTITIVNLTAKDQPLVQGTRLLSDSQALFRTTKTILVPARGKVLVDAKADNPEIIEVTAPMRFTIVALWEGLRDKIYGEIKEPINQESRIVRTTNAADIERSRAELEKKLFQKGMQRLRSRIDSSLTIHESLVAKELIDFTHTGVAGLEQDAFTASATMRLTAVATNDETIRNELLTEQGGVVSSKELLNNVQPAFELSSMDLKKKTARILVRIEIPPTLPQEEQSAKKQVAGKTPKEISDYFRTNSFARSVKVTMFPFALPIVIAMPSNIHITYESVSE